MKKRQAIFLDRDGTINADTGYTHKIAEWRFLPGAVEGLAAFKKSGWLLVGASNQSGIGRGYYTTMQLQQLEAWVNARLAEHNAMLDAWYYCPHLPEAGCACRKPRPGLLLQAAKDLNIDLSCSWMLGDKESDIKAGLAAGCHAGLISPDQASRTISNAGVPVWASLAEAAEALAFPAHAF